MHTHMWSLQELLLIQSAHSPVDIMSDLTHPPEDKLPGLQDTHTSH